MDDVVLFREFFQKSDYRPGYVRSKYIAEHFTFWLKKNYPEHSDIDSRNMVVILRKWGASNLSRPMGSTFWRLGNGDVCVLCGGHMTSDVCDFCKSVNVPANSIRRTRPPKVKSGGQDGNLEAFL